MKPIIITILGYALIYLLSLLAIYTRRSYLTILGGRAPNTFPSTGDQSSHFSQRLSRCHANLYENFPVFLGIVLIHLILNKIDMMNSAAYIYLGGRVFQSLIHILSTSKIAVMIRFSFALIQYAVLVFWIINLF